MAEPEGPVEGNTNPAHMTNILPTGRQAHAARTGLALALCRKLRKAELTAAGVEQLE
eukprot:gene19059-22787_t